jgi:hypothetical protein
MWPVVHVYKIPLTRYTRMTRYIDSHMPYHTASRTPPLKALPFAPYWQPRPPSLSLPLSLTRHISSQLNLAPSLSHRLSLYLSFASCGDVHPQRWLCRSPSAIPARARALTSPLHPYLPVTVACQQHATRRPSPSSFHPLSNCRYRVVVYCGTHRLFPSFSQFFLVLLSIDFVGFF